MCFSKKKDFNRRKERGSITISFLLISFIFLFFILSFLFLNMTLVHVSVTQYISYSSARRLFLSNQSQKDQFDSTIGHYDNLRNQFFSPGVYRGGSGDWFAIPENINRTNIGTNAFIYYPEDNTYRKRFYGVNLLFKTFILKLKIPMLATSEDKPLSARVGSFLGREPSEDECKEFYKKKYEQIKELCDNKDCPGIQQPEQADPDNGC